MTEEILNEVIALRQEVRHLRTELDESARLLDQGFLRALRDIRAIQTQLDTTRGRFSTT